MSKPSHSDSSPPLQDAFDFLTHAQNTGVLGFGPGESVQNPSAVRIFLNTIPIFILSIQFFWSSAIVLVLFFVNRDDHPDTLDNDIWTSRAHVPSFVSSATAWALFVLLSFFIREATKRYRNAAGAIHNVAMLLRYNFRMIVYNYPKNTWHPGDIDRIMRHFVAYPIALKMSLRGEREQAQLGCILHPADVKDVIAADSMHTHCLRVIRAYTYAVVDEKPSYAFKFVDAAKNPAGKACTRYSIDTLDKVDMEAQKAVSIREYRSSIAYVNHLHIFLYIWMLFLPLALVETSGWFTVLWAVIITYAVGMLFTLASALNDPFGFDLIDTKLNRISASNAIDLLNIHTDGNMSHSYIVDNDHETPKWLEIDDNPQPDRNATHDITEDQTKKSTLNALNRLRPSHIIEARTLIPLASFVVWCVFIVFLTWGISDDVSNEDDVRWWYNYIPLDNSTAQYVSLGIFLLIGFWLSDAYSRYWRALEIWKADLPPLIDDICIYFAISFRQGLWHSRDHERFFSHLAAIPYVAKQALRGANDYSELGELLSAKDILRISVA